MSEDSDETVVAKEESAAGSSEAVAIDSKAAEQPGEVKPASVGESAPTLREVFSLPEKEGDPSDDRWQAFQDKVNSEVKKIKWTATMPDLAPKVCELLNIKIPDVLITAWKKVKDIQAIMEKSKKTPDETVYLELAQHTIKSEHKPSIDIKIKGATVKKIEMVIQLGFDLKGFLLKIQNGAIKEMQTGQCEAKGTIKYGGLTVAERKLQPIKLPFSVPIPAELFTQVPEVEAEKPKVEAEKPAELERIEL